MQAQHKRLFALSQKHQLPYRVKRFIPDDWRKTNYRIAERIRIAVVANLYGRRH